MRELRSAILFLIITLIPSPVFALPTFVEIRASYKKSDAFLLDRRGQVIQELRVDTGGRRLAWVTFANISPALIRSVIHSEDQRFYDHRGVDWLALGAATVRNARAGKKRGASTITMQLAAMIDKNLKAGATGKTLRQKWKQLQAARELEKTWSKDQILEAYLNLITFRGELQGVAAAARGLFGKEPSGLNFTESVLLAALIRAPNAPVELVAARARRLAALRPAVVPGGEIKTLAINTLSGTYRTIYQVDLAPHAARKLLVRGQQKTTSTLDGPLQRYATATLNYHLQALNRQNVRDGAVIVLDNETGEILAYVANSGPSASARHVDGIVARRLAGSTLKPFLYALALEKRLFTAASLLDDSPLNVPTAAGIYMPHNYDNEFKGFVSVRTALASSLNIPAVRALMLAGTDNFVLRLKALGFRDLKEGDYYGLSMALGSVDISLYELTNAYRSLANGGRWSEAILSYGSREKTRRRVFAPEAAFIVSHILADRTARGLTFGYENQLATRFWTAVKTGTSKDMRDNWCVGFSGKYTVGVWVGNFSGEAMWNVSGTSGAAPVWLEVMNFLHRNRLSRPPAPPAGIVAGKLDFDGLRESSREEWFIKGTEPMVAPSSATIVPPLPDERPRITYPPAETIILVDPDIPEENSAVFLAASAEGQFDWLLNNQQIGNSSNLIPWKPRPGKYRLSLVDRQGQVIDSLTFEVRGVLPPPTDDNQH